MRTLRRLLVMAPLVLTTGCLSSYSQIDRLEDGSYVLIKNERALFAGNEAEVIVGTYDPATKTMTITRSTSTR